MSDYVFFSLIGVVAGLWIYFDATRQQIGRYRDSFNSAQGFPPLLWGILTLLFWLLVLPIYLFRRRGLMDAAKIHPVKSNKWIGFLVMIIASILVVWYSHLR